MSFFKEQTHVSNFNSNYTFCCSLLCLTFIQVLRTLVFLCWYGDGLFGFRNERRTIVGNQERMAIDVDNVGRTDFDAAYSGNTVFCLVVICFLAVILLYSAGGGIGEVDARVPVLERARASCRISAGMVHWF